MQTSDQTVYLYKKSLGLANTNVNKVAGLEVYTSPLTARSANIYTQTVPDLDLSTELTSDTSWNLGTSSRKFASAYPYIAYYENVPLATMSDNPGIAFQVSGNQDLLKGTLPAYKLLVGGVPTTPVYTLTVKNSVGTTINSANYMVDPDAGIVMFYGEPTVSASLLPTISFWRYEGTLLSNTLITNSISATSLRIQTLLGQTANFSTVVAQSTLGQLATFSTIVAQSTLGVGTFAPQFLVDIRGAGTSSILRVGASGTGVSSLMVIEAGMDGIDTVGNVCQQTFRQRGGGGGTVKYDLSLLYNGSAYGLDFVGDRRALFLGIDGQVGVGTNNPGVLLDVAGAGRASSFYIANRGYIDNHMGNTVIENNLGQGCTRLTTTGVNQSISYFQAASSFYFTPWYSATPVMMIGTNGNFNRSVGVNTTAPSYNLDVISTIRTLAQGGGVTAMNILEAGTSASSSNVCIQRFTQLGAGGGSVSYDVSFKYNQSNAYGLDFLGNGSNRSFFLTTTGSVGLGTTSPNYTLDVRGSGCFQSNFNLQNLAVNNVLLQTGNQQVLLSNASAPYMYAQTTTSGTSRVRIGAYSNVSGMPLTINENGGNVGINIASPSAQLHVNGSLLTGGAAGDIPTTTGGNAYYTGGFASPVAGRVIFGDGTGWQYRFARLVNSQLTDLVSIRDNGFVGIGTTSPNYLLDVVNGDVRTGNLVLGPGVGAFAFPSKGGYTNLSLTGGNSVGYLFGAFGSQGDGIHLSYNWINDNTSNIRPNSGAGQSAITLQFGSILLRTGIGVDNEPSTRVTVNSSGYVGIGTVSPNYPLDVNGFNSAATINGWQLQAGGTATFFGTPNIGIHSQNSIWSEGIVVASSDQRIKKDIVEIDDNEALDDLRKIEPKKYKYIDTFQRGNTQVYGFLAQQVSSIITNAVSKQTSFIPDIYSSYTVAVTRNQSTQYLSFETSPATLSSLKLSQRLKFHDANQEFNGTISSIQTNHVFLEVSDRMAPPVSTFSSMVFLYGTEVDDFLTLNKDSLFTLAFAATQQIDRIQQSSLQTVAALSVQLSSALARLDAQESTIAALLAR